MAQNLIDRRERAMDRADRALDAAWPERKGSDYVGEMQWAVAELSEVASKMSEEGVRNVEQSRAYRYLGSVYSDLSPALGSEMLISACKAYRRAEALLDETRDEIELAKLNFNFANALRQVDPDNIEHLQEAKQRLLFAKEFLAEPVPQFLPQINTALQSVESLLRIAPLVSEVDCNRTEMEAIEDELKKGGDVSDSVTKARKLMKKDIFSLVEKAQVLINELPPELQQSEQFDEINQKMSDLTATATKGSSMTDEDAQIMDKLGKLLEAESNKGNLSEDRAGSLRGRIENMRRILAIDDDDVQGSLEKLQKQREFVEANLDMARYPSYGIHPPPEGSRAAELVENCWLLRRFVMEEMSRPNKAPAESKECLDLNVRATKVDKRIYETGGDDKRATAVEMDDFRPLALAVRKFSARAHTMLAKPVWPVARSSVDINAVFYSGPVERRDLLSGICDKLGLTMLQTPTGESISTGRWKLIQKAITSVFDLGLTDGSERAAVAYELGIALTLGKPVVIVATSESLPPFDVAIEPVILRGGPEDVENLSKAIDRSITWTYDAIRAEDSHHTLEYILSEYGRPNPDVFIDQTLRLFEEQKIEPDPVVIDQTVAQFVEYLRDGKTMRIYPVWQPVYPNGDEHRLFHVTQYGPEWANEVTRTARLACKDFGVTYIRGDEMDDPNIIRSIWEEIARATHVLVDLTDFSANVALELGIAHTLGRRCLVVGQPETVDQLKKSFPMVARQRFYEYTEPIDLEPHLQRFLGKSKQVGL